MSVRDLIPWGRSNRASTVYRDAEQNPFVALHRQVNRLFDDVFNEFEAPTPFGRLSWSANWPNVEISETDNELRVIAEVPGLEEKDIEVLLDEGVLTLRGEKKSETEDKERQFSERFYGRFERGGPSALIDLERALVDPASVFHSPADVVADPALTLQNKCDILKRWAWDEYLWDLATAEGMPEGERPSRLHEVELALLALEEKSGDNLVVTTVADAAGTRHAA